MRIAKSRACLATLLIAFAALLPAEISGCGGSQPQPTANSERSTSASPEKRYHLEGRVVSVDRQQKRVLVDGKDIPGFMAAMTMPYPVADDQTLAKLMPADQITADVIASGSEIRLDNVVVKREETQK